MLGPLEVRIDGEPVALGSRMQRALLALLLLRPNEVVPTERLVDELWGEHPPATATHSVEVYVSRLRRALEPLAVIDTRHGGYATLVDPRASDVAEFQRLVADGRDALEAGDHRRAADLLRGAERLWRGPPLAELQLEGDARFEIHRLEDLRVAAIEERVEAELGLGRHAALVGELERLVREHPYRERLRRQLMLALYRSGRQAEALASFRTWRTQVVEELGIEPGDDLQRLHRAMLGQDPELEAPASTRPLRRRRAGRRRWWVLATTGALAAAAGVLALVMSAGGAAMHAAQLPPNAVGSIDGGRKELIRDAPLGPTPTSMATGAGAIWITNAVGGTVAEVDPRSFDVTAQIPVGNYPTGVVVAAGAVWVANTADGTVSRIDPGLAHVVQTIDVGKQPVGLAAGPGAVWVANSGDDTVTRIDAITGRATTEIATGVPNRSVAFAAGSVWVTDDSGARVLRIDPRSRRLIGSVLVGSGPAALAAGFGSLWVANSLDGTVSRIAPGTERVAATIRTGDAPAALAAARDGLWVGDEYDGSIIRIDPTSNAVDRRLSLRSRVQTLTALGARLAVATGASLDGHRGGTLRVLCPVFALDTLDPALAYTPASQELVELTNDGLTSFARVPGPAGTRIVPDLAVDLPPATADGRSYTFKVRRGIRYSTGATLRPEDFRRGIERSLELGSPEAGYYSTIVGAATCSRGHRCDLSDGIVADDATYTVTFHLRRPDPELFDKLALSAAAAVPPGATRPGRPVPGTGPYEVVRYVPNRDVRLKRNPFFSVWSTAAQPPGYPDVIQWSAGGSIRRATEAVATGRADLMVQVVLAPELLARFPRQIHINPDPRTLFAFLNTRIRPFNDVRARRALNYALDRRRVTLTFPGGNPTTLHITCQVLPPGFSGYRPYCPYTAAPTSDGTWRAPDFARARQLVRASRTQGARITMIVLPPERALARYLVGLLDWLGYRARARIVPGARFYAAVRDSRNRTQLGIDGWEFDYPAPSNFFVPTLSCAGFRPNTPENTNEPEFCDPRIDRLMRKALALESTDPVRANFLWGTVDRKLTDAAPWAPLFNAVWTDFAANRVGNYEFNPQGRVLLDQLWVR